MHRKAIFALVAVAAGCAGRQSAPPPDPSEAKAKVPAFEYRSAFAGYQRHADPELAPWREVNDEVGRTGGHAGHVKPPAQSGGQR